MTEKGYKGGLVSRVRNIHSRKRYVVSTAQEIGLDYWTTSVFPGILFGLLPSLTRKIFTIVRNSKEEAHAAHWETKQMVLNTPEEDWFQKMPNPEPSEGWSADAKRKLGELGINE